MSKCIDLSGQKFGRLTVIKQADDHICPSGRHLVRWLCRCECGDYTTVIACHLKSGHTTSCGCFNLEKLVIRSKKHELTYTRLYYIWASMKSRCYNSNDTNYKHYGARGITICDEWKDDVKVFYDWAMANGYDDKAKKYKCTIDRIDVNKGYSPENCRWVDMKIQGRNKRSNRIIAINGESHCLVEWCEILNLKYKKVSDRINKLHWSPERALEL